MCLLLAVAIHDAVLDNNMTAAIPRPRPSSDFFIVSPKARAALFNGASSPAASFRMLHPDKSNWSAADHHVRFVVGVINNCILEKPDER